MCFLFGDGKAEQQQDNITMAKAKLTKQTVDKLTCPPGKAEEIFWDEDLPGFGLRIVKSGKAVYVVQYRNSEGRTKKMTLGDRNVVEPQAARSAAKDLLAEAQLGGDPQADAKAVRHGDTVREVMDDYLKAKKDRLKPRSYVEVERALTRTAKPLHPLKISMVSRGDVTDFLNRVAKDNGPVAANRTRANLSALWSWAIKAGRTEPINPVAATHTPGVEKPRDRILSSDELRLIWKCSGGGHDHDRIVRLLLLTAARRDEIGSMAWQELVETEDGGILWTLPKERAKNGVAQELPLCPLAISQLPPKRAASRFVFGNGATPFSGWSKCKERLDERMLAALSEEFANAHQRPPTAGEVALPSWRLHDLRRTFATWASNAGHPPHLVEAVLNHVSGSAKGGVAGVYNLATYRDAKGQILKSWADHVKNLASEA